MSKRYLFSIVICLFAIQFGFALTATVIHTELDPVVQGEKAHFELNLISSDADFYEGRLFYRAKGASDFQSQPLKEQGYTLFSEVATNKLPAGKIDYYFAMQTLAGEVITYPQFSPQQNPLSFELVASNFTSVFQNQEEVIVLSPEEGEIVPQDEFLIAVSIPNQNADVDHARTRLLIDGIDVTSQLQQDANLYTLVPKTMRTGSHNAEFKIFDSSGNLLNKQEWNYRITSGGTEEDGFKQKTNVYLDNRYQNISDESNNYFRGGVNWDANYNEWDFRLKATGSSTDGYSSQSPNRFGALVAYNFSPRTRLYLKGGDLTGDYDQLTFWNRRILGFGIGLNSPWFDLDVSTGQTASAVEGKIIPDETGDNITANFGTFKETFLAVRPVFNFGKHVSWGLNLINGKEDPNSIKNTKLFTRATLGDTTVKVSANPTESLVLGTTLRLNFDNNRIRFAGSFQASIANKDASSKVDFDSLAEQLDFSKSQKDQVEPFVNLLESTGFLTISQGLAPFPALAMQFDTYLNYFNNHFKFSFKNIESDYVTPGNPYLLRGIRGLFINDNIRLANNQVFLNLYFNSYKDNLSQEDAETDNSDLGVSLSYFPMQSLPSITLSYGNQSRKNDADAEDVAVNAEDNSTQRVSVSSNYSFHTGSVKNTATVSVSNIVRDDNITREIQLTDSTTGTTSTNSDFKVLSLSIKNQFAIPFTSRIGFSQTTSLIGEKTSITTENNISRYYANLEYKFKKVAADMDMRPFFNFALSQVDNGNSASEYNRINYTAGLYLNSFTYGNFSLRFDYIDFGDRISITTGETIDYKDMILSTRYDVTF
ncbi:MAG: hypothetical protein D8M58_10630 [Calditrichaeota bacterium]|nr:MAG: hypothetical protein DWQ03_10005 [Calditrichota bacterium]MBL1205846.1 hypothetical protein [Calditrichota bacterium]